MNGKHYKLRFLPLFEDDLNGIVDYIAGRLKNPVAAEALVNDVQKAIRESDCAVGSRTLHCQTSCLPGRRVRRSPYTAPPAFAAPPGTAGA